jgi:uncharacterized cupin superfamily protein
MSKPHLVRAAERGTAPTYSFQHPLNPRSQITMCSLSDATGLERLGVHVMRVPPGKESFIHHLHYTEEEFVFILSGRGIAELGDDEVEVGPGDFLGFPTPSIGHHLRNPFDEELVYLAGGERHASEIADFPKIGKRLVRAGMALAVHSIEEATTYPGFPVLSPAGAKAKLGG